MNKFIKMPKEMWEKWDNALRSGEYMQGKEKLESNGCYCCLGVLQMVVDGKVERNAGKVSKDLPTYNWLRKNNITFRTHNFYGSIRNNDVSPTLPTLDCPAHVANDSGKYDFVQIADAIKATVEFNEE